MNCDKRAWACWDYNTRNHKYVFDIDNEGFVEYWQFPIETMYLKKGDCEDSSLVVASLMLATGIPRARVRCVIGNVKFGGIQGGHCWVEYLRDNGDWVVFETTIHSVTAKVDSLPIARTDKRYTPYIAFNDKHSWRLNAGSLAKLEKEFLLCPK